jgi:hypothetical protein
LKFFREFLRLSKRVGFVLFINLLVVLIALVVVGVAFLKNPDWVVNERSLHFLANLARSKNWVNVSWDQASSHIESRFLIPKKFRFNFQNLCISSLPEEQKACWKSAEIGFQVGFVGFKPKVTEVGPVHLLQGLLTLSPSKKTDIPEVPISLSDQISKVSSGFASLQGINFHSIFLSFHHRQASITIEVNHDKLGVRADLKNWVIQPGQYLSGKLDFKALTQKNQAELEAIISGRLSGKVFKQPKVLSGRLTGKILDLSHLDRIHLTLNGKGRYLFPDISESKIEGCLLDVYKRSPSPVKDPFAGKVKLDCPAWVRLPSGVSASRQLNLLNLPSLLKFRVYSDFDSKEYPPSPTSELKGSAVLEVEPISTDWLKGQGKVSLDFSGVPKEFPKEWKTDADVALNFQVPEFEALVYNFSKTSWAVPAPFHVLKGNVGLEVHGRSNLNSGDFPLALRTRLTSENQKLDLDGQGHLSVRDILSDFRSKLDFKISLSNVDLELPRLDLAAPPRIVPEERFKASKGKKLSKNEVGKFNFVLELKTPVNRPLNLLSNLAKAPIPVHVQFFLSSRDPVKGFIRVKDFPLEVFRRDATMDHFDLTLTPPAEESKIDGLINVKYVDYTVSILIGSTLGKPAIKLMSDPPLPEDKIVATLLFGKPMEELNSDQESSVGSTRAALADEALGIASLYVLASTPVQSVGYDPVNKLFTAKLRLAEGTSLNLGAGSGGLEGIGIRKRLGTKWSITTDVGNSKEGDQNKMISTFLEWVHRY